MAEKHETEAGSRIRAAFRASEKGRLGAAVRVLFLVGISAYLVVRLSEVGWDVVIEALPTTPFFYLLFFVAYLSLPAGEVIVYRYLWRSHASPGLLVFLRKRVLNKDLIGYSGEVYLYAWAKRHLQIPASEVLKSIKDANVLSALASTVVALLLVLLFVAFGHLSLADLLGRVDIAYAVLGGIGIVVLLVVAWRFRRYVVSQPLRVSAVVFFIYAVRLLLGQAVQIGMFSTAMPDVSLAAWFTFSAVSLIISRIPFIPAQDLFFIGASVELSGAMGVSQAGLAGMLLSLSVLDRAVNAILFGTTWRSGRRAASSSGSDPSLGTNVPLSRDGESGDASTKSSRVATPSA